MTTEIIATAQPDTPYGGHTSLADIEARLEERYKARGWSRQLWINDRATLRRLGVHPQDATLADLEQIIVRSNRQSTRANYTARLRSMFRSMNDLGLITNNPAAGLADVRKPRGVPRPLTEVEARVLCMEAAEPYRSWFVLGCFAGLRAMEVSGLMGADLEDGLHGPELRVRGKGGTDLTIPAHDLVVEVIRARGTLGRLWNLNPNKVSAYACAEMHRMGVEKKFHSCRHYFATSALRASGGDLLVVRDLMRHGSVAVTQVYTQLEQERPRAVLAKLAVPAAGAA